MNAMVRWVDQRKTILHCQFVGKWGWNDFDEALQQSFAMTDGLPAPVDLVLDFSDTSSLPDGALLVWKNMLDAVPKNLGKIAFVGGDPVTRTTVGMFRDINATLGHRLVISDTLERSLALLKLHRPGQNVILVIEDEDELRQQILDVLQMEGYQTISASDGAAGLAKAQEAIPDLILCDLAMPQMDGYRVLMELRHSSATNTIPFIFLTAQADRSSMRHGMELGADDYLTKPFTFSELLVAVKARLERKQIS